MKRTRKWTLGIVGLCVVGGITSAFVVSRPHNPSGSEASTSPISDKVASNDAQKQLEIRQAQAILKMAKTDTTWGTSVQSVKVINKHVDVYTSIYPDQQGRSVANRMAKSLFTSIMKDKLMSPESVLIYGKHSPNAIGWVYKFETAWANE